MKMKQIKKLGDWFCFDDELSDDNKKLIKHFIKYLEHENNLLKLLKENNSLPPSVTTTDFN